MTIPVVALQPHLPGIEPAQHPNNALLARVADLLPGLALAAGIAGFAYTLRQASGFGVLSPMILAILLGIGFHNLIGTPQRAKPGVTFAMKKVLRFAIILLGFQLTAQQVAEVGFTGVAVIASSLVATFAFTKWLGQRIGVERKLAELIAAGTSICGASAVLATNMVTEAHDEDVAYAVACVTVFGSLAMFLYPVLPHLLHLTPRAYGLWAGASIHEIAQVVAAAFQTGKEAGDYGTIAKLTRVTMLAPVVTTLGLLTTRRRNERATGSARPNAPIPYFVFGFIAVMVGNSLVTVPTDVKSGIIVVTTFLLSLSLAAMGLETDIRKLLAKGVRPLVLGAVSWAFIAGFSLALIKITG
jgi:uncharacterized integral membrane protein (TIGR00698 family)